MHRCPNDSERIDSLTDDMVSLRRIADSSGTTMGDDLKEQMKRSAHDRLKKAEKKAMKAAARVAAMDEEAAAVPNEEDQTPVDMCKDHELLTRTSYVNARIALNEIKKVSLSVIRV